MTTEAGAMELVDEGIPLTEYPKLVEFEEAFRNKELPAAWRKVIHQAVLKQVKKCNFKEYCLRLLPIVETLKSYQLKEDLPNDLIAGVTAGVMMIPQGMAFAALSTLPPILGLYISFFSSIVYALLGTGRQLSWGCIAILSLMMAAILDKYDNSLLRDTPLICKNETDQIAELASANDSSILETVLLLSSNASNNFSSLSIVSAGDSIDDNMAKRIEVASAVTLVAGIILVVASQLGLSRVASLMSNSMITGFTVGVAFHVATSQLKTIFGIKVPRFKGPGSVIRTWFSVLWDLPKTNIATLITSIICISVLYLLKKFINDRYKKQLRIPIPIELLVVIVGTVVSYFAHFQNFGVQLVETVPIGVPAPKLPDLSLGIDYIGDGIIIIVIAYAQTLAMAKTLAIKNNYVVDANQEMLATGLCSVVCALFSGFFPSCSVSRSAVQDGAGGKTQIASLVAAILVLLVILFIGPYFYYLPMCVLSAVIVVNLQTLFLKLLEIPAEWRKSRYDCAVWVFSLVSCIVLNADVGLLAGLLFSVFLVIARAMFSPVWEAGQIQSSPVTVELRCLDKYGFAKQLHNVRIMKVTTPLYFINVDIFTAQVFKKTSIDPIQLKKKVTEIKISKKSSINGVSSSDKMLDHELPAGEGVKVIILDLANVSFIDLMGVQALQFLIKEFSSVDVEILITSVPENLIPMLKSTGFWDKFGDRLFMSVETALASLVTTVNVESAESFET